MTIVVKGKMWTVIKKYPNFYLCINKKGIRECFSIYDF